MDNKLLAAFDLKSIGDVGNASMLGCHEADAWFPQRWSHLDLGNMVRHNHESLLSAGSVLQQSTWSFELSLTNEIFTGIQALGAFGSMAHQLLGSSHKAPMCGN